MGRFLIRRLVQLVPIWIGISLIAFVLATLSPGDPARMSAQELYGRPPTAEEKKELLAGLAEAGPDDRRTALEDLYWGVLSTKEFLFNH